VIFISEAKRYLLSANSLCYALVRLIEQIKVLCHLNIIYKMWQRTRGMHHECSTSIRRPRRRRWHSYRRGSLAVSCQQCLQRSTWKKYFRLLKYSELTPTKILSHLPSDALRGYVGLASTAQATPW